MAVSVHVRTMEYAYSGCVLPLAIVRARRSSVMYEYERAFEDPARQGSSRPFGLPAGDGSIQMRAEHANFARWLEEVCIRRNKAYRAELQSDGSNKSTACETGVVFVDTVWRLVQGICDFICADFSM